MPSTVEQLNPTRVKLTIELPFTELQPNIDKAYNEIGKQVKLPGFRKGHVPTALIDQRFGRGAVLQEAINDALPGAYGAAVAEHKVVPLGQPDVEVTKLEDGEVVEFTAEVDVRPEFDLPDLSAIKVEVPVAEVSDDDLQERLDLLKERFATTTEVERPAADGDLVVVDLEARQNGEVLDDATATGVSYKIGSGRMLEGLDEAVTGLSAGESADFSSKLLGGAHRDEDADIHVTVTKVQEQTLPEVDDEFAQMVSQFDTAEEMLADLRKSLEQQARAEQAGDARDKVLEAVLEQTDFELPQAVVDADLDARKQQVTDQLQRAGLSVEQYLDTAEDETAETPEEFWADIEKRSLEALRAQVVLDKLAEEREFEVTQQDLTQMLFQRAQQNGTTPDQEVQHLMEHNHLPEWSQEIRRGKALNAIVTAATVTDANGEVLDLEHLTDTDAADEVEGVVEDAAAEVAADEVATDEAAAEADAEVVSDDADTAKPDAAETDTDEAAADETDTNA